MNQHNSRYGFLVTNQELVAIRKLDENGNLELAQPILWTTGGTATQPRLTVMLALWYIGMLASHDQGVNNWQMIAGPSNRTSYSMRLLSTRRLALRSSRGRDQGASVSASVSSLTMVLRGSASVEAVAERAR
ncbi:hypothetical protein ACO22_08093 [Paracoccidioides brasiliensis]|uniref:Uncharacterized protein n=1 Tax=Paracoccidioides brasiliensis TaxID=121759 RepID=A0A1D2J2T8_PARBR|nr:hypothetical protein ACO22_08093 [Paracoccidioides brasiliensis]